MNSKKQIVEQLCKQNNWNFEKLCQYVELIEEKNKIMNLTGFSGDALWEEGILESLEFMHKAIGGRQISKVLDIGAGVGFPSVPFFITNPIFNLDIFEPIQKRCDFLNLVINELKLKNIKIYKKRIEDFKQKNIYDLVTARAVMDVQSMLLAGFHVVGLNSEMVLLKSKNVYNELKNAAFALSKLKIEINIEDLNPNYKTRDNKVLRIKKLRSCPADFPYTWKEILKLKQKS
ncbi:16S rRNA (guanine527-N7)-methyltransferase [Mycoplasmopsis mustelae]|uniref:Ribosomal RNA small subunit methyltransferase G n=1 Tax=Mycoplasmopsis mustelae TaxID=171289 RepID=A0A4R7UF83_9BACT|nr:16S rRNA (guanine(527)-N(7))-methyltransferase RsmG [Mycoplasmopsis mustelae]TDV24334.1 16S rRNA (guanine527-N7)-methyltransferase [Mycoplasmopsis mustelae]